MILFSVVVSLFWVGLCIRWIVELLVLIICVMRLFSVVEFEMIFVLKVRFCCFDMIVML